MMKSTMFQNWRFNFSATRLELIIHLLIWFFFGFVIWSIFWGQNALGKSWDAIEPGWRVMLLAAFPVVLTLNTFWLIPAYLKKRRWVSYVLGLFILVLSLEALKSMLMLMLNPEDTYSFEAWGKGVLNPDKNLSASIFLALIFSFGYRFTRDWLVNLGVIERLKSEKAIVELEMLKSQINPHFLFNTLNSLYSLALSENSPKTADGIAQLGTLMRYNLHDAAESYISLEKELQFLQRYSALQLLRSTEAHQYQESFPDLDSSSARLEIAPMIILPLLENAFKYGIGSGSDGFIRLDITVQTGKLVVDIENSISAKKDSVESGGVGLNNVRQRLKLLYPGKHELTTRQSESVYHITLKMELS